MRGAWQRRRCRSRCSRCFSPPHHSDALAHRPSVTQPIPFSTTLPSTLSFLQQLLASLVLATQTSSPAFALPASDSTRKDRPALERVLIKSAAHARLQKGLGYYFEAHGKECVAWAGKKLGEREKGVVKWGVKVALETLSVSGIVTDF